MAELPELPGFEVDESAKTPPRGKALPAAAIHVPTPPAIEEAEPMANEVQDSVEEVLQQSSAQALKLSHLEDLVATLTQNLNDVRDEMHAGFVDVRAATEQSVQGALRAGSGSLGEGHRPMLTQNMELLEEQLVGVVRKQTLLVTVGVIQTLLMAATLVGVIVVRATLLQAPPPPPPAPPVQTEIAPTPDPVTTETAMPAAENDDHKPKDAKKKKTRRH